MSPMKLYSFWRSGTSHRTRIALGLKGLSPEYVAVHLAKEEHLQDAFKAINPQQLVPALDTGSGVLIQSPAILEWLEEKSPTPALLPRDPQRRARVRALAAIVGCDIHPGMSAQIVSSSSPFSVLADATGAFTIANVPNGPYSVTVYAGPQKITRDVNIAAGAATLDLTRP